jgi:Protein of unknown function (DUF1566)
MEKKKRKSTMALHLHVWVRRGMLGAAGMCLAGLGRAPARAEAPPCRYAITVESVTDNDTGLVWQRAVQSEGLAWQDARAYCAGLLLDGGGFQLPTAKQLNTLVDERESRPTIDRTAFPGTPSGRFWSFVGADDPWVVDFSNGQSFNEAPTGPASYVRCVRPLR